MTFSRRSLYGYSSAFAALCLLSTPLATLSYAAENDVMTSAPVMPLHTHDTLLSFTTEGEAKAVPNRLAIHFSARVQNTSPVTAQKRLNQLVQTAMGSVKNDSNVSLNAGNYTLSQEYNEHGPRRWNAEQTLTLKGADSAHLLTVAETLQSQGLGLNDMDWSIDPQTRQKLENQARTDALKKIRSQANSDAEALGLRVVGIERVQIDHAPMPESPFPAAPMLMSARASSGPAPQSTPEEQTIRVSVSTHIRLAPENALTPTTHTASPD